jgi:hypothetical protein
MLIRRWSYFRNSGISFKTLFILFSIKFITGLALTSIYSNYYTERREADIFKYFDDSAPMFSALPDKPIDYAKMITGIGIENDYFFNEYFIHMNNWDRAYDSNVYNDSHTIIRLNAIFRIFSFNVFHVHTLFFCFISFIGSLALFRAFRHLFNISPRLLLLACFLLPSVLLWTSGILKESILIFAFGIIFMTIEKFSREKVKLTSLLFALFSIFLMIYIKFYVLLALLPALIGFLITKKIQRFPVTNYIVILILATATGIFSKEITGTIDLIEIMIRKQQDFIRLAEWQDAKSAFPLTAIENSFWGILKVIPEGLLNCFVRPLPHHVNSWLSLGVVIENLLFILLCLLSAYTVLSRKLKKTPVFISLEHKNFFLFCLVFTLLLFTVIGITTPVAGALVRYKVPALPFLMMGCLLLFQREKSFVVPLEKKLSQLIQLN